MNGNFRARHRELRTIYETLVIKHEIMKTIHQQVITKSKYLRSINSELRITSYHIKRDIELTKIKKDAGITL